LNIYKTKQEGDARIKVSITMTLVYYGIVGWCINIPSGTLEGDGWVIKNMIVDVGNKEKNVYERGFISQTAGTIQNIGTINILDISSFTNGIVRGLIGFDHDNGYGNIFNCFTLQVNISNNLDLIKEKLIDMNSEYILNCYETTTNDPNQIGWFIRTDFKFIWNDFVVVVTDTDFVG